MNSFPKRPFFPIAALLAAAVLAGASTLAVARPVIPVSKPAPQDRIKFDTRKFMPESDVRYGQKGYALTVLHGTRIERFSVVLLGVLMKVNNGKDLILFKATSGPSVTRHAMIVAGMSGSPVYVGGRMVGAIAYGLPFSREPMGMITPIKDMLDSWDPDLPATPGLTQAESGKGLEPASGVTIDSSTLAPMAGGAAAGIPQGPLTFEPMMTPIAVSGMSPQGIAQLALKLAPFRLMPVAGGGSASINLSAAQQARAAAGMTPGAAVGVSLAQGDMDLTAIGTLTYRDGNKIVAFGHPFTGIGPIDAALTTASITDILPSYEESTKMGMPLATVGRIFQDRPFSVGGTIGTQPHMIPVSVSIDDESDRRHTNFNARVINHPLLTGILTLTVVNEAILEAHGTPGDAIAYVTTDVDADQVGHIIRKNVFFDPMAINATAVTDLNNIVSMLSANPFYQLGVRSVNVKVRIQDRHATAEIDHIIVPRGTYAPGETIDVGVVLRPYKKDPVVKTVALTIPSDAQNGPVTLSVRGGEASGDPGISIDSDGGLTVHSGSPGDSLPPPATVEQLVKQYLAEPKNNDLVASLLLPSSAPEVGGEKLSLLPPTMSLLMRSQHASAVRLGRDEIKQTCAMPWVITGSQSLSINVQAKENYDVSTSGDNSTASAAGAPGAIPANVDTSSSAPAPNDPSVNSAIDGGSTDSFDPSQNDAIKPSLQEESTHGSRPNAPAAPAQAGSGVTPPNPPVITATSSDDGAISMIGGDSGIIPPAPSATSVARVALIWRENTESAFDNGTLDGVTVTNEPDIRVAPDIKQVASTSTSYVWSQAYDKQGNLYIGTGDDGQVFKIVPGGKPVLLARTQQLEVTAMVFNDGTGDLYAATAPHGVVYRINAAGEVKKLLSVPDPYLPALLLDRDGKTLYLASAGGTGRVYAADVSTIGASAQTAAHVIFTSPDVHLLCLAQGTDGSLYTGGNPNGVVYKIDPHAATNKGQVVYDSPGPTVTAVAIDGKNRMYVGTADPGSLYRVDLSNLTQYSAPQIAKPIIAKTANLVSGLASLPDGTVWASSGDTLYHVAPGVTDDADDVIATFPSDPQVTYTTVAAAPNGGGVTAGTASIGDVYGFTAAGSMPVKGSYISAIHDARLKSRWGVITWSGDPKTVQLETRTGDVAIPDTTWSDWSVAYHSATGSQIVSPPARFIQYRAILQSPSAASANTLSNLSSVSVYYMPENRPPSVHLIAPVGGDSVSGSVSLRWTGTDPDRDTLEYRLYWSSDNGVTWTGIDAGSLRQKSAPSGAPVTAGSSSSAASSSTTNPNAASAAASTRSMAADLANHPEIPANVRQSILQAATTALTTSTPPDGSSTEPSLRAQTYTWKTKQIPDGVYRLKVVTSDAPSNAQDALTDEVVSDPFTVVNTPPVITLDPIKPATDGSITVSGTVKSTLVFTKAVQYKVDDGGWMAAAPADGLFDSSSEAFSFTTTPTVSGPHHITIEAFDRAGNTAMQTVDTK